MAPQTPADPNVAVKPTQTELTADRIQVDDKIYSAIQLASIHPGGELFVKAFSGRDATEAFLSYHRREFPHSRMTESLIGAAPSKKDKGVDEEYLELCQIVEQILPRTKSFAPISYYLKLFVILGCAFGLEFYMHYTGTYVWYLSAVLGWFFALIGLNVQHDANHGAISRQSLVNRTLGYMQNWIGGSSIDWVHQHVVQHHVNTNDVHHDPDIAGSDILRLNPLKPLLKYQIVQHLYFFLLIGIFGYIMIFSSLQHVIEGVQFTPMSKYLAPHRVFEVSTSTFFIFRWFLLPLYQQPSLYTLLNIAPMFVVGGYYLAFFFIISHNFVGVQMYDQSKEQTTQSFLRKQAATSSNVGGSWLCFINGGLNYQIEHHLFPRIQHSHYPKIAPAVRAYCEKKNIPYVHFPTISENMFSCIQHLQNMGSKEAPVELRQ